MQLSKGIVTARLSWGDQGRPLLGGQLGRRMNAVKEQALWVPP